MLNELLARVQTYADERQMRIHHGTVKRVVYSAQDIVDGQYLALLIHFDRDRNAYLERLGEVDKTWHGFYERKIDAIDTLDYELHTYHSLYKHLVEAHIAKDHALEVLSNEKLLRMSEQMFKTLYDNTEASNEVWQLLGNIVFDIAMVFECNA